MLDTTRLECQILKILHNIKNFKIYTMDLNSKFKTTNIVFFIFVIFVILHSLSYLLYIDFEHVKIFKLWGETTSKSFKDQKICELYNICEGLSNNWRWKVWTEEDGLVEYAQVFILICVIFYLVFFYTKLKTFNLIKFFILIEIIGISYFFFEEISWGQHIIKYSTPDFMKDLNHQGEFNLHNISSIFNELPRNFIFIWCAVLGPLIFFAKINLGKINLIILPNKKLILLSLILLSLKILETTISHFNLIDYTKTIPQDENYSFFVLFWRILSLEFIRISELYELMFSYYFLWHSIFLKSELKNFKD